MRFFIEELEIVFPYEYIYPEQYSYMVQLKKVLDNKGHGLLEMPSGTGKTVTILSFMVSYQVLHPHKNKLVYCSRTVPEIDKALAELQFILNHRKSLKLPPYHSAEEEFLALGLSSRKKLCLNPQVNKERKGSVLDAKCHERTASWRREKALAGEPSIELCPYFEALESLGREFKMPPGAYTLEDLQDYGLSQGVCPYFLARNMLSHANIVIYSYYYLLDPKIAAIVSKELSKDCIIVFDEAHNIDNVCIEALSIDLNKSNLEASSQSLKTLSSKIEQLKALDMDNLKNEYELLVQGLRRTQATRLADEILINPIIPEDILNEVVPGNIRKAEHFISFLKRWVEYLKVKLKTPHVSIETPFSFLQQLNQMTCIEKKPLKFCAERLASLIKTLELVGIDELFALQKVAEFATLVSSYSSGFLIIFEPFNDFLPTVPNPILHLCCLDASISIKPIFSRFESVIITSGTLSPLDMYPKILCFKPSLSVSFPLTLTRRSFSPLIVSRGSDQVPLSSRFESRNDLTVIRNYGHLLLEMCKVTPDGVVVFFPSYIFLESIINFWDEMGLINEILKFKLLFIETPDSLETSLALENYQKACDNGRGAVLLSVARGKVSEGIDFDHHYGRAVILMGIPYQYTESRLVKARLEYLREKFNIKESDFLTFDAMRHAAQCLGRVLRGKNDYGLMILADKRFSRADKRTKLPFWISNDLLDSNLNLSTDMAVNLAKKFFKTMAQEISLTDQLGVSLWNETHLASANSSSEQ